MSKLRPECIKSSQKVALPDDTALFLIRDSIARRRALLYGRLHDDNGHHCAIGCFWADHPHHSLSSRVIDEVAAVNDSVPPSATPHERWKKVNSWIRFKLKQLSK